MKLILQFDHEVAIQFAGDVRVQDDGSETLFKGPPDAAVVLIRLFGQSVAHVSARQEGTLTIGFSDVALSLLDSELHYASYQIHNGEDLTVV